MRHLDRFGPVREQVRITPTTVCYTPTDKCYDVFIALVARAPTAGGRRRRDPRRIRGQRAKLGHESVRTVVVMDTIAVPPDAAPRLRVVPVAPFLADAVRLLKANGSLGGPY